MDAMTRRSIESKAASVEAFADGWRPGGAAAPGQAEAIITANDPRLGRVIEREGPRRFRPSTAASPFDALARAIVYQQLSGRAAGTIYGRLTALLGAEPSPRAVLGAPVDALRSVGLSSPKIRYLRALAERVEASEIDLGSMDDARDDEVAANLSRVPGVGPWTVQMFLMFRLRRQDVLPAADVGVRRGLQVAHGLGRIPAPGYVERAGRKWSPFRSIACLYLWAAVDLRLTPTELRG